MTNKKEMREVARLNRQQFVGAQSPEELADLEWQRVTSFLNLKDVQAALVEGVRVGLYHAMGDEASTALLMETLSKNGIPMALPRVLEGSLVFQTYAMGDDLIKSSFGVMEPLAGVAVVKPTLYVMPLLAFDKHKNRLGYGKGHYDSYFSNNAQGLKVGWAYGCQQMDIIDAEVHDIPLDHVII